MSDPHVESLHYEITSGPNVSYQDPEPMELALQEGRFDLRGDTLVVEPSGHFATAGEARAAIEPVLRAWEIHADLVGNPGTILFRYRNAKVIDRNPPPPGAEQVVIVGLAGELETAGALTMHLIRREYPAPPATFRASPDIELAHNRWIRFREGAEPLLSMAYFVLTLVEVRAGGRKEAAEMLQIEPEVLQKLGELTSTRGDGLSARKLSGNGPYRELSGGEQHWVESTVRAIILRMGGIERGVELTPFRMQDLPRL